MKPRTRPADEVRKAGESHQSQRTNLSGTLLNLGKLSLVAVFSTTLFSATTFSAKFSVAQSRLGIPGSEISELGEIRLDELAIAEPITTKSIKIDRSLSPVSQPFQLAQTNTPSSQPVKKPTKTQIIAQAIDDLKQSDQRWIEIRLKQQRLLAWEGNQYIYGATVSTGKASTPTLKGVFAVQTKLRETRMRGADYNIPDVPYTMYYDGGYAIHGAYWHNRFGTPISHGCINLKPSQARWLFNWAKVGTPVVIRE